MCSLILLSRKRKYYAFNLLSVLSGHMWTIGKGDWRTNQVRTFLKILTWQVMKLCLELTIVHIAYNFNVMR